MSAINLKSSPFSLIDQPHIREEMTLPPKRHRALIIFFTTMTLFILCFHALFNHHEGEPEIEEEEPQVVVFTSPGHSRKLKRE